jgi:hypothetical protein
MSRRSMRTRTLRRKGPCRIGELPSSARGWTCGVLSPRLGKTAAGCR